MNHLAALRMRGEVDGASFKIQDYEIRNAGRLHLWWSTGTSGLKTSYSREKGPAWF